MERGEASFEKSSGQSKGWPTEMNFEYLHTKDIMSVRNDNRFGFLKCGPHPFV